MSTFNECSQSSFTLQKFRIRAALGVSEPYSSAIQAGVRVPHPRHWQALAKLVEISGRDACSDSCERRLTRMRSTRQTVNRVLPLTFTVDRPMPSNAPASPRHRTRGSRHDQHAKSSQIAHNMGRKSLPVISAKRRCRAIPPHQTGRESRNRWAQPGCPLIQAGSSPANRHDMAHQ